MPSKRLVNVEVIRRGISSSTKVRVGNSSKLQEKAEFGGRRRVVELNIIPLKPYLPKNDALPSIPKRDVKTFAHANKKILRVQVSTGKDSIDLLYVPTMEKEVGGILNR